MHKLAHRFDGTQEATQEIARRSTSPEHHDASIDITVDRFHPRRLDLQITDIHVDTASTKTFRLARASGGELPPFLAGQYVNVFSLRTSRPYAISSSPTEREFYDLTVRRVPGGRISNHLVDNAAVGDHLETTGPMGTFHHNPLFHGDEVVFLAGGSGVAPAMSMIRDIVNNRIPRRFHLVYGSRSDSDIIFRDELASITDAHHNILVDHVIAEPGPDWTESTGFLSARTVTTLTGPLRNRMVYVCGPQALYQFALGELACAGHPRKRIRFEANGAPQRPEQQAHWPAEVDSNGNVAVTIGDVTFRSPRNRPLLDALEDEGIRPEAACRSGECSLCRVRVMSGEVFSAEEARLRLSDQAVGYVHSCVAYPLTDVRLSL